MFSKKVQKGSFVFLLSMFSFLPFYSLVAKSNEVTPSKFASKISFRMTNKMAVARLRKLDIHFGPGPGVTLRGRSAQLGNSTRKLTMGKKHIGGHGHQHLKRVRNK